MKCNFKLVLCFFSFFCSVFNFPVKSGEEFECDNFEIKGMYVGEFGNILIKKISTAKKLGINAFVIDIKNDFGEITCDLGDEKVKSNRSIKDIKSLLETLKKEGIYTIARIVSFKDKEKTKTNSELAIKNKNGTVYVDREKMVWLNPYKKGTQDYVLKIAKLAAKAGFDEIHFDYIRIPPFRNLENTDIWEDVKKKSKICIINEFIKIATKELHEMGVKVSAAVFGCTIPMSLGNVTTKSSANIGQDYIAIASEVDYICPMIYPSHWPDGSFGIPHPDLVPYGIVEKSMLYSNAALQSISKKARPWIQAFTATWLKFGAWKNYGKKQVQEQINALKKHEINGFLLWNSKARYSF
ncbi:MAG: putative glycoside hydrolase [Holosporales bacterium]|jgi:hypothetical protein|nr:putative glycoside hydrolase [Holosporales bacterium]